MDTKLSSELEKVRKEIIDQIRHPPSLKSPASSADTIESLMGRLSKTAFDVNLKTKILSSLDFVERQDRSNHITSAIDNTFKWISNSSTSHSSGHTVHFTEWLKSKEAGDNYFWISGKPGSGKSTLMKYLSTNGTVAENLTEWAKPKQLFKNQFYFWISGSEMLKNELGFLRTLAFDILKSNPDAIPHACSVAWGDLCSISVPTLITWKMEDLLMVINRAINWEQNNLKYCFFIDGLDEYKGRPDKIIELLLKLPMSLDTKCCISSRKWNDFEKIFGVDTNRKRCLYLEEQNADDIRTFISKQLEGQRIFREWTKQNQEDSQYLVNTVVSKSAGVFLWVDLVVRSLIRGINNEDSLETLQKRLWDLPEDLNDYFDRMLDTVEAVYQPEAAKIYQVMLQTTRRPYLILFAFIEEKNPDFGALAKTEPASETEVEHLRRQTRLRINARCTDLLDITETPRTDAYFQNKVEFLHRTVRDFMKEPKTKDRLSRWLSKDTKGVNFDPRQYICQATVAQVKRAPIRKQYLWAGEGPITELADQFYIYTSSSITLGAQEVQNHLGQEFMKAMKERGHTISKTSFEADPPVICATESDVAGEGIPTVIVSDFGEFWG